LINSISFAIILLFSTTLPSYYKL